MIELKQNQRLDDLGINGLKIIQDKTKYCFNSDSVLLADFVNVKKGDIVCDFGTGSGIIPILLLGKSLQIKHIYGIEIQDEFCSLALRNAEINNLSDRFSVVNCDINNVHKIILKPVNIVVCNPPYFKNLGNLKNTDESIAIARHEIKIDLQGVITSAFRVLKSGGRFYFIHRAERLQEILSRLESCKFGVSTLRFVYPKPNLNANTVLVEAVKDSYPETKVLGELVVRNSDDSFTSEINEIYTRSKK